MSSWQQTDGQGVPRDAADVPAGVVQIRLEELGKRSWRSALFSAVIGAGGGPLHRFVAAEVTDDEDEADEHHLVSAKFPLQPFQDLEGNTDDRWAELARRRLHELDVELQDQGWRRLPGRGPHWWSLRYTR